MAKTFNMAKTFEVKCLCAETKTCDEAGLVEAQKRCADCNVIPQTRVKLSFEDNVKWAK